MMREEEGEEEDDPSLNHLFLIADPNEELFTFEDIEVYDSSSTGRRSDLSFSFPSFSLAANKSLFDRQDDRWVAIKFSFILPNNQACSSMMLIDGFDLYEANRELSIEKYRTVFSIGMCVLCWFWMGFACRDIAISDKLVSHLKFTQEMRQFWTECLNGILAEFMYVHRSLLAFTEIELRWGFDQRVDNNMDEAIHSYRAKPLRSDVKEKISKSVLVPIGGGKDSLVVWHLANEMLLNDEKPLLLYVNDEHYNLDVNYRLHDLLRCTNSPCIFVRHDFRCQTFLKYSRSYFQPCGHPWAALVLFDSLLVAIVTNTTDISFGFEKSADEGNAVFLAGREVNHQYDKSSVFMEMASKYVKQAISADVKVFSPLTNMWELEITRIFCQTPALQKFHSLFLSCNEPIHGGVEWCLRCEKCAFIYLLLSAWLSEDYIHSRIFPGRQNMLRSADTATIAQATEKQQASRLREIFLSLLGKSGQKPFECVGTVREAKLALCLVVWRYTTVDHRSERDLPPILTDLCEFVELPCFDRGFWYQFASESEVLQHYEPIF